jgi:DNA-directed RNA polymerase specialized sigma24 family protein
MFDREFEVFVRDTEPRLRRALVGHLPLGAVPDALAEAYAYAWEHWDRVSAMDNPVGYLYRVAQSKSRRRRSGALLGNDHDRLPDVEPGLAAAVRALPHQQRAAVWLVHACGWTYPEAAAALGISSSALGTHLARGMASLRNQLGEVTS